MVPGYGLRPCECQQFCRLLRVALLGTNVFKFCQCYETGANLRVAEPCIRQKRFDLLDAWLLFRRAQSRLMCRGRKPQPFARSLARSSSRRFDNPRPACLDCISRSFAFCRSHSRTPSRKRTASSTTCSRSSGDSARICSKIIWAFVLTRQLYAPAPQTARAEGRVARERSAEPRHSTLDTRPLGIVSGTTTAVPRTARPTPAPGKPGIG